MPYFVIGMPLIIIFAVDLGWFPTSGMLSPGVRYDSFARPAARLRPAPGPAPGDGRLGLIGGYSILMRSSIIETRSEDYVTTARAKGLTDGSVLRGHAFPNALLPTVTLIAINLGYVVAGAITVEVVFNWPGLGTLTVDALTTRDYPVLQGVFLLLSVLGHPGQPRRRPDLRPPRSAGPDVTRDRPTPVDAPRPSAGGCAAAARATSSGGSPAHATGVIGLAILVVFTVLAIVPEPVRRPARDRRSTASGAPLDRRARPTSSGPTSSAGTSST